LCILSLEFVCVSVLEFTVWVKCVFAVQQLRVCACVFWVCTTMPELKIRERMSGMFVQWMYG
jgi:hypothetical protein